MLDTLDVETTSTKVNMAMHHEIYDTIATTETVATTAATVATIATIVATMVPTMVVYVNTLVP